MYNIKIVDAYCSDLLYCSKAILTTGSTNYLYDRLGLILGDVIEHIFDFLTEKNVDVSDSNYILETITLLKTSSTDFGKCIIYSNDLKARLNKTAYLIRSNYDYGDVVFLTGGDIEDAAKAFLNFSSACKLYGRGF